MLVSVEVKNALEEQVRLLSERSKKDEISTDELCELSLAMAQIIRYLAV